VTDNRKIWRDAFDQSTVRAGRFATMSGVPLEPVYGPDDGEFPGQCTPTRGASHASMYRSRLWTMRMFAGFGTAEDTNVRFKDILRNGRRPACPPPSTCPRCIGPRLRRAEWALGEVGRCRRGRWTRSLTWRTCSPTSTSSQVSTSMTINGPAAPIVMAMYIAVAEKTGVRAVGPVGGTIQNDIFKEYQAQKEYIFPPAASRCGSITRH
jgi:methylmalonyl-CoA mutase, N-terminal domain